ncbi:DET1- and DDB1-associated protein 1 isoform X2 [Sitophilus oryzae]|uniref:DET1- and DDB1-associated protein 1 n=1 Tax=Sitophilus oryzae TaxID=7048 RepID=A0A6J2YN05_SITOR|nr:DET1- and DDB1-associated protein 1 isoform X2 [Sitophilus oryzae]
MSMSVINRFIHVRDSLDFLHKSVAKFLAGLPSFNENNFSKFHVDSGNRSSSKRPSVYIPTKDYPAEQIIVTEKTSILLKYMQQHWDKKNSTKKREVTPIDQEPSRKRARMDGSRNILD